jgi:dihydroxyacetone kinase DhaKLM complex PTS-EIIA-like component DhaM
MAGKPFDALKKGAQMVSETIFQSNEFQNFVTVFYDTGAKEMVCKSAEDLPKYKQEL